MSSDRPIKSFGDLLDQGGLEIGDGYRAENNELGSKRLVFLRAGQVKDTHTKFLTGPTPKPLRPAPEPLQAFLQSLAAN